MPAKPMGSSWRRWCPTYYPRDEEPGASLMSIFRATPSAPGRVMSLPCLQAGWVRLCVWAASLISLTVGLGAAEPGPTVGAHALAVDLDRDWQVSNLAPEAGISGQRVFDLCFSPEGTAWLACADGLYSYDGYTWLRYGREQGLPSDMVRCVCMTRAGELWVGTDAGAGVFEARMRRFERRGSEGGLANQNVRMIREDADGSLWFCCDQWPDSSLPPGGLSVLKGGVWRSQRQEEGLPMDYVIATFLDSGGERFAMTPQGWVVSQAGAGWTSPGAAALALEPCIHFMAEGRGGDLFAQGEKTVLFRHEGRWFDCGRQVISLGAGAGGRIFGLQHDAVRGLVWFAEWENGGFTRASATLPVARSARFYRVVQAPDGSVWAVGTGSVLRWSREAGPWSHYGNLGSPRAVDAAGRLWFSGRGRVQCLEGTELRDFGVLEDYLGSDGRGIVYGHAWASGAYVAVDPVTRAVCGQPAPMLRELSRVVLRTDGRVWHVGKDAEGRVAAALERPDGSWLVQALPESAGRKPFSLRASEDGRQLWCVLLADRDAEYDVYRITEEKVERLELGSGKPPITYPLYSEVGDRQFLQGYGGLFMRGLAEPAGAAWTLAAGQRAYGYISQFVSGRELLVISNGGKSSPPACLLWVGDERWQVRSGNYDTACFSHDGHSLYLSSRGMLHLRRERGNLEMDDIPLPEDSYVQELVEGGDGRLWMATADGVLCYKAAATPPRPQLELPLRQVPLDAGLELRFSGRERWRGPLSVGAFRYSWRLDDGAWSPFERAPTSPLSLAALVPGRHVLELRCRNAAGVVSAETVQRSFEVEPVPLQRRFWFYPVVLLLFVGMALLAWQAVRRGVLIAKRNRALRVEIRERRNMEAELRRAQELLENRVAERTRALVQTNEALKREMDERTASETLRKQLERQLQEAQKMQAIGTLAGGIAHDFNNILAVIIPCAHLALKDAQPRSEQAENLQHILTAGSRAKSLVSQILSFSRKGAGERMPVALGPVVKETIKLLRHALSADIEVEFSADPELPDVLAEPTQLHQVVMNLCSNAAQSMEGRRGRVMLRLTLVEPGAQELKGVGGATPMSYVMLEVRDTGAGIAPELLDRIFEPFFTTRRERGGTGLGLSVVHGIVRAHEGQVTVESELGKGSVFRVFLPAHGGKQVAEPAAEQPLPQGRGQQILVVDDEPIVGRVIGKYLEAAAYRVVVQLDPQEALRLFEQNPEAFELVITDRTMPGLGGPELARRITSLSPGIPIILVTGFDGGIDQAEALRCGIQKVLGKPLNQEVLLREVARVFGG